MSKIGRTIITIPKEVKVGLEATQVKLEGPKGKLSLSLPVGITVENKDGHLTVNRLDDVKQSKSNHGTVRALLANMVVGVSKGYKKNLEIQGVGYRAQLKGSDVLLLNLGFSHQVEFKIPKEVKVAVPTLTEISIEGSDKAVVGHVAAQIRAYKPPEPYKGKGIRYVGEFVRRKQGKSVTK